MRLCFKLTFVSHNKPEWLPVCYDDGMADAKARDSGSPPPRQYVSASSSRTDKLYCRQSTVIPLSDRNIQYLTAANRP